MEPIDDSRYYDPPDTGLPICLNCHEEVCECEDEAC